MVGPPYPSALRLYAIADGHWAEIEAAYYQIDLLSVGSRKFLNLVFAWCLTRIQPEQREEWIRDLEAPLPGQVQASPAQVEQEGMDFMAAMQMHEQMTGG